jgi:uncharacterized spore protein YtfJ
MTVLGTRPLDTKEPGATETGTQAPGTKPFGMKSFGTRPLDPQEILAEARESLTVRRVFGEPIEKEGLTIVPVAQVMGGFGAGGPAETGALKTEGGTAALAEGAKPAPPVGIGGGFGVVARPAGVYVIREGRVRWMPSVDVTRLAFRMVLGAAAILWVLRPVLMLRAQARARTV